ncbi:hypothetical protein [Viridibacterium curvum]|uniref:Transcription factor zinc-finger domain-containing protein n=1 Tax=Viridibacterium curvum TaxID=1101404 RepID=A0ABP9QIA7_9RHOO
MEAPAMLICPHCGQTRALHAPDGLTGGLTLYVACPACPGHYDAAAMQRAAMRGTMHATRTHNGSNATWLNAC